MLTDGDLDALYNFESWDAAKQAMQLELEDARRELLETNRKIEQSQIEVDKLAKRNASTTAQLQQVQAQLEATPRTEIQSAYDSALDALQRLFVMRGQLDKFQSRRDSLMRYLQLLEGFSNILDQGAAEEPGSAGSFATVEMMIRAQEAERQRLSRQMHDGPAQALSNFILQTEIATRLFDMDQERARDEMRILKNSATTTFQQVRDFIFQLRPMMLDDLGLIPTVKRFVDALKTQSGLDIEVSISGADRRLEPYLEVVVFRSIQELLNNAISHSQASEIKVQLDIPENEIRVHVEDNGKGFDIEVLQEENIMGMKLIKERTEMLGGGFEIDSEFGQGTRVSFNIPMGS